MPSSFINKPDNVFMRELQTLKVKEKKKQPKTQNGNLIV